MSFFEQAETGRIRGNPTAPGGARAIPSRAARGWAEGVETRRGCGIAHRNTPTASGTRMGEEIVSAFRNEGIRKCAVTFSSYGQTGRICLLNYFTVGMR